ncbi:MAG: hypothetical protein JSU01_15705 [Bacteroidetes bacterium]|nr:hypothetical protein [Bacteroidota bacterium]
MLKYLLSIVAALSIASYACAKGADTTILYFKVINGVTASVTSLDEADFFRLVLPPDSGDKRYNIQEFYKNGKVKLVAKAAAGPNALRPTSGVVMFDGDCIAYYPNGKKSSIIHYQEGRKDGLEYVFYPTGRVYCCIKHYWKTRTMIDDKYWECYDTTGNQISTEGNGRMIVYDNNYHHVKMEGPILNGYMDGEWHGVVFFPDTIKYICQYKKGVLSSSIGYDRKGNSYPFQDEIEKAHYKSRGLTFIEVLRSHIKLPRDANGKKMSMDTMHVSFVVEKDGHLSNYQVLGEVDQQLKDAIFAGLDKMIGWTPQKIFGIPYRTEIIFPLNETSGFSGNYYNKSVMWQEKVLKDN